jgi:D-alanine-D-alanine ligase
MNKTKFPFENIHILFLARFAGKNPEQEVENDPAWGIYPFYHHEMLQALQTISPKVTATNDLQVLVNSNGEFDFVFSLYNQMKFRNSEIFVSSFCEYKGVPYLGSTPNIRAVAEDKVLAKLLASHCGVPTPRWIKIERFQELIPAPTFHGPYFVKPNMKASSKGISEDCIQSDWKGALEQIRVFQSMGYDVMVEEFIEGENVTLPIVANWDPYSLPCMENISNLAGGVISNGQKRKTEGGLVRKIYSNGGVSSQIAAYSSRLYAELQPIDYARFDYRVQKKTQIPFFLEVNVCCNLGSHSTIAKSAEAIGVDHIQLIKSILAFSLDRQKFKRKQL